MNAKTIHIIRMVACLSFAQLSGMAFAMYVTSQAPTWFLPIPCILMVTATFISPPFKS